MAEMIQRQAQLKDIAQKLRSSGTDDIEKAISYLAIASHYVGTPPHFKTTPGTLYVLSLTQKVLETYHKMYSSGADKKSSSQTISANYHKHLEKAAAQLEAYASILI